MISDNYPHHNSNEWDIDYSNPLGKGELSKGVYKARKLNRKPTNCSKIIPKKGCAIKIIGKEHIKIIELKEIDIIDRLIKLKQLEKCDEVIEFYGYGFNSNNSLEGRDCYIYMEYLEGFSSLTDIKNQRDTKRFEENEIIYINHEILKALRYLHKYNIIHRDIKCDNILYNQQTGQVKLIDFGISIYTQTNAKTYCGTKTHMAPETKIGNTTTKSDIYSLGCTMIEMAGGNLSIENNKIPLIPKHLCKSLVTVIGLFITEDLFYRPGANNNHLEDYGLSVQRSEYISLNIDFSKIRNLNCNNNKINGIVLNNFDYNKHSLSFIPPTVTELTADQPIPVTMVPSSIKEFTIRLFNEEITHNIVPPNVKILNLPSYNQPIKPNSIPPSILSLYIPSFNHDLEEDSIPKTLVSLELGESFEFNEYGGNLPDTIKVFSCGYHFKSSLKKNNNIPRNVSILCLRNYNQPIIEGSIPATVSQLTLQSKYIHFESLSKLPKSVFTLALNVEILDKETQDKIEKYTPDTVFQLIVNNKLLRSKE